MMQAHPPNDGAGASLRRERMKGRKVPLADPAIRAVGAERRKQRTEPAIKRGHPSLSNMELCNFRAPILAGTNIKMIYALHKILKIFYDLY